MSKGQKTLDAIRRLNDDWLNTNHRLTLERPIVVMSKNCFNDLKNSFKDSLITNKETLFNETPRVMGLFVQINALVPNNEVRLENEHFTDGVKISLTHIIK